MQIPPSYQFFSCVTSARIEYIRKGKVILALTKLEWGPLWLSHVSRQGNPLLYLVIDSEAFIRMCLLLFCLIYTVIKKKLGVLSRIGLSMLEGPSICMTSYALAKVQYPTGMMYGIGWRVITPDCIPICTWNGSQQTQTETVCQRNEET